MKQTDYNTIHDTAMQYLQSHWDDITFAEVLPIESTADIVTCTYLLNDQLKANGFDYYITEDMHGELILSFIFNRNKCVCINCGVRRWVFTEKSENTICTYDDLQEDIATIIDAMNFTYFLTVST